MLAHTRSLETDIIRRFLCEDVEQFAPAAHDFQSVLVAVLSMLKRSLQAGLVVHNYGECFQMALDHCRGFCKHFGVWFTAGIGVFSQRTRNDLRTFASLLLL
ncbi:hypothetical protein [Paraburkholderia dipogonis]|uniref:hypothetical protein n=1 Tax=Paraburkholderia dipogonis TaxID=1211383 RepID=UPI0038BCBCE0